MRAIRNSIKWHESAFFIKYGVILCPLKTYALDCIPDSGGACRDNLSDAKRGYYAIPYPHSFYWPVA